MHAPRTFAVLLSLSLLAPLAAQGSWTFRSSASNPSAASAAMVFDSSRNTCVLTVNGTAAQDTWVWDGSSWTPRLPVNKPGLRTHHAMAYDAARDRVVHFGGRSGASSTGDVLEWDAIDWAVVGPVPGTFRRERNTLIFDPVRQKTLLFGGVLFAGDGVTEQTVYSDTAEWAGSAWTTLTPVTQPSPRYDHAMAYDSGRNRGVLFGGKSGTTLFGDTWEWNGTNWTEVFPAHGPSPRRGAALAHDSAAGLTYLFGGEDGSGYLADTWVYDGSDWTLLTPTSRPARRAWHAMVHDASRGVLVLFGGSNGAWLRDTWEYTPGIQGTYSFFGAGCAGSRGTPSLSVQNNQVPIAGQPFSVQLDHLPLTGQAWMFLGASKTDYGGLPLPADLSIIGMFGCSLYVSGDLIFPVRNVLGVGLWTITVPPVLLGLPIYNQAIVFDPSANALGLTVSDAGEGVVGG